MRIYLSTQVNANVVYLKDYSRSIMATINADKKRFGHVKFKLYSLVILEVKKKKKELTQCNTILRTSKTTDSLLMT